MAAMPPRFANTGMIVADMAASLAFYRRLGVVIPPEADAEPHVQVAVAEGVDLCWDTLETITSFDPSYEPPAGGIRMSLGFACDSPAEVDATYAELIAAGHHGHLEPFDAFWGQRYASLADPDGNGVDLYAPLPAPG